MTTATNSIHDLTNLAELVEHLGDIPLERIRLHPFPGTATERDVIAAEAARDKRLCELIDGVLVEKAMGFLESLVMMFIGFRLMKFNERNRLGLITGESGMMRLFEGRVRIPDLAFVSWDRLPDRKIPTQPVPGLAPDLAVEIISPGNTKKELELKRVDYFSAGVRLVWEIDPRKRAVRVYRSLDDVQELSAEDSLNGEDVLPGFSLPVADIYAELDQQQ